MNSQFLKYFNLKKKEIKLNKRLSRFKENKQQFLQNTRKVIRRVTGVYFRINWLEKIENFKFRAIRKDIYTDLNI